MRRSALVLAGALVGAGLSVAPAAAAPPAPVVHPVYQDMCGVAGSLVDLDGEAERGAQVSVYRSDGTLLGSTTAGAGQDEGGAWSTQVPARVGVNTVYAVASDATGDSPHSNSIEFWITAPPYLTDFTATLLRISPRNAEGVADRVVFQARARMPGGMVFDAAGGTSGWIEVDRDRTYSWTWDGRDTAGRLTPSGTYRATAFWYGGEPEITHCPEVLLTREVIVDDDAPRFRSVLAPNWRTFYPRRDDAFGAFRNTVTVRGERVNELTGARVQLFRHGGTTPLLTKLLGTHYADTDVTWVWNGRHADGSLYPQGAYDVRFRLRDSVGNTRWTPRTTVQLSREHVVARTLAVQRRAASYSSTELDPACDFGVSRATSEYEHGLRQVAHRPGCAWPHLSRVNWRLPLPRAAVYSSFQAFVFGAARNTPTRNGLLLETRYRTGVARELGSTGTAERRHLIDPVHGGVFVQPDRTFLLTSKYMGSYNLDFDARDVGVIVRYGTLAY